MTLPTDEVREKLINTTLTFMDEDGLNKVKARPIANAVGISVGTIYNLFGSIDGLIQETNTRILEHFGQHALADLAKADQERASQTLTAEEALREQLLSLAEAYIQYVEQYHGRWSAMLAYNRNRSVEILSEDYTRQQDALFGWIAKALEGTQIADDETTVLTAARALWSAVHGIVALNYIGHASEQSKAHTWQQIDLLVTTFVRGALAAT